MRLSTLLLASFSAIALANPQRVPNPFNSGLQVRENCQPCGSDPSVCDAGQACSCTSGEGVSTIFLDDPSDLLRLFPAAVDDYVMNIN